MRINRNNGIMETSPCKDQRQGQGQGLDHKDQDKDKDLTPRTRTRTRTSWTRTPKDKDKDKDLTPKDQDKDKDLKKVLKESLRTRTRTRINIPAYYTTTKSFTGVGLMLREINADQAHFKSTKNQFFKALYDNLVERFSNTKILTAAQALDVKLVCAGLLGSRAYFKESLSLHKKASNSRPKT